MANRTKQRKNSGLTLTLYNKMLHPELFKILATEQISRRAYDADVWLVEGGHVVTFAVGRTTLSEVVLNHTQPVTDRGLVQTLLCRGERYHETKLDDTINYMISTQEEQLTHPLYEATKAEIIEYAGKRELMTGRIPETSDYGAATSVLDVERRAGELVVHSFHLFDEQQLVVKTQGIFEVLRQS